MMFKKSHKIYCCDAKCTGISSYWRIVCVARFWSFEQWKIFSLAWLCCKHLIQMWNFFKEFFVRLMSRTIVLLIWLHCNRQYCKKGRIMEIYICKKRKRFCFEGKTKLEVEGIIILWKFNLKQKYCLLF